MKKVTVYWSIVLFCLLVQNKTVAQILPHLGWYEEAQLFYNPSYAGSGDELRGVLINRGQWKGIKGSPQTYLLGIDAPLGKGMGFGGTLSRDEIGHTVENKFSLDASYRIYINSKSFFQTGIKAAISHFSSNFSQLSQWDDNDPLKVTTSTFVPRVGFGLMYIHPKYYAGISFPDFYSYDTKNVFINESQNKFMRRNYFFTGGTKIAISEYVSFVPTAIIRYYEKRGINYTLNIGLELNQTINVGLSYVHPAIYGIYGKVALSPRFKFGYRHEYSPSVISVGTFGTGEFLLTYGFH